MSTSLGRKPAEKPVPHDGRGKRISVTPTQVAAAKLRVVADRRLGRPTPSWVVDLANAKRRQLQRNLPAYGADPDHGRLDRCKFLARHQGGLALESFRSTVHRMFPKGQSGPGRRMDHLRRI